MKKNKGIRNKIKLGGNSERKSRCKKEKQMKEKEIMEWKKKKKIETRRNNKKI